MVLYAHSMCDHIGKREDWVLSTVKYWNTTTQRVFPSAYQKTMGVEPTRQMLRATTWLNLSNCNGNSSPWANRSIKQCTKPGTSQSEALGNRNWFSVLVPWKLSTGETTTTLLYHDLSRSCHMSKFVYDKSCYTMGDITKADSTQQVQVWWNEKKEQSTLTHFLRDIDPLRIFE